MTKARIAILAAFAALSTLGGQVDAATPSTAVGVSEREFRISLYRGVVPPGEVRFNVTNFGEDAHNLVVLGRSGRPVAQSAEIKSGKRATVTAKLRRAGTYRLLCTTADHTARGMRAKILVRKPKRTRARR